MKSFIVTLANVPESFEAAQRCAASAQAHGLWPDYWPGVWRDKARDALEFEGLRVGMVNDQYSNPDAVIGNFVAQYRIWCEVAEGNRAAVIMEHDAVVVSAIPKLPDDAHIVNLGRPSFGRVPPARSGGLYPLFSRRDKLPGAHGYYVTPKGAADLVRAAQRDGAHPVDVFISPQRFRNVLEYVPWPIEARDSFTTIQKKRGCIAKHNFNQEYKIL